MSRDYKAEFGYEPTWREQHRKQEAAAENRDERLHGEIVTLEELADEDEE